MPTSHRRTGLWIPTQAWPRRSQQRVHWPVLPLCWSLIPLIPLGARAHGGKLAALLRAAKLMTSIAAREPNLQAELNNPNGGELPRRSISDDDQQDAVVPPKSAAVHAESSVDGSQAVAAAAAAVAVAAAVPRSVQVIAPRKVVVSKPAVATAEPEATAYIDVHGHAEDPPKAKAATGADTGAGPDRPSSLHTARPAWADALVDEFEA